jgi:putative transposase
MSVKYNRRSTRLRGYDYSSAGAYFVTICVQNRICVLGDVVDNQMILNDAGRAMEKWYFELQNKYENVGCGEYVVMPNHVHAVIHIDGEHESSSFVGADLRVCPDNSHVCPDNSHVCPDKKTQGEHATETKKGIASCNGSRR